MNWKTIYLIAFVSIFIIVVLVATGIDTIQRYGVAGAIGMGIATVAVAVFIYCLATE